MLGTIYSAPCAFICMVMIRDTCSRPPPWLHRRVSALAQHHLNLGCSSESNPSLQLIPTMMTSLSFGMACSSSPSFFDGFVSISLLFYDGFISISRLFFDGFVSIACLFFDGLVISAVSSSTDFVTDLFHQQILHYLMFTLLKAKETLRGFLASVMCILK